MKKIIITLLVSSCSFLVVSAQPGFAGDKHRKKPSPEMRQKMEAYKIAFFTEGLELTSEEAQQFFPIFNERERKMKALKREYRPDKRSNFDAMNEAEIQQLLDRHFEMRQRELDLNKEYAAKFIKVLPPRKVFKIRHLEREFKRTIMNEFKKRKGKGQN